MIARDADNKKLTQGLRRPFGIAGILLQAISSIYVDTEQEQIGYNTQNASNSDG